MAESSRSRAQALSPTEVRRIQDEEAYPYIIIQEIGKGSFATVYKGKHHKSQMAVAIKTVSRSILTHKLLENLESEIAILKALRHKNITELKDIVKARNNIYLIMEFCSGGDLSKYIRHRGKIEGLQFVPQPGAALQYWPHPKSGGLDPIVVRSFLGQLASALKFLRARNLIHRDIKPQNLLLEPSKPEDHKNGIPVGVPLLKIADFGFARSLPNAALAETLCGSPLYMAPEILRYEKYDARADLWSVGAVLYEMSVGRPPFRAQNHMELLKKIEHARGRVSFPDEREAEKAAKAAASTVGIASSPRSNGLVEKADKEVTVVPPDMKVLIRMLLKRKPVERASFDEFFASEAVDTQLQILDKGTTAKDDVPTGVWKMDDPIQNQGENGSDSSDSPPRPRSKDRRISREMEKADKDALPLEGTPYDPKLYVPQPAFKFRRTEGDSYEESLIHNAVPGSSKATPAPQPAKEPSNGTTPRKSIGNEEQSDGTDSSTKPEKEYVIVDAALSDSANDMNGWKRPSTGPRSTSTPVRGAVAAAALTKQVGRMVIGATIGNGTPHPARTPSHPVPIPIDTKRRSSGFVGTPSNRVSEQVEYEAGAVPQSAPMTFPPPPAPGSPPIYGDGTSRSQQSALARAINYASKKLLGSPTHAYGSLPPSTSNGTPSPRSGLDPLAEQPNGEEARDELAAAEDKVLQNVENIAQKAQVLKEFADSKFAKVPSRPVLSPAHFTKKKGEPPRSADSRRKMEMEAEQNAVTSVALYLATMSFCQKGMEDLNTYCAEHVNGRPEPSSEGSSTGIDDALTWFQETFKACMERSEVMKAWLPEGRQETPMFIDRVIYDHALALMRRAASKELLEENFPIVQNDYERALWMLYAISDDVIQEGNPYRDQDVATIETFIETTKTRLMRLKRRIETVDQRYRDDGAITPAGQ